jgi:HAD superfamily hydrolase (TIGR01509 family)
MAPGCAPLGIVHGVPDRPDTPLEYSEPDSAQPLLVRRPVAVLFDFHGTLVQVEDPVTWVLEAARTVGADLDRVRATALADRLVTAGRAGGPLPHRVPPQLAEVYADRDLYPYAHRAAYTGLMGQVDTRVAGLVDALYDRLLVPEGWVTYPDTVPTLKSLRAAGVPVVVISNIGFDIRGICAGLGFADLVDGFVLSYEVGRCKPDPAIFRHACALLGVEPEQALMVGDAPADAGAIAAGCRAYLVPPAPAGRANGIAAVLDLVKGGSPC